LWIGVISAFSFLTVACGAANDAQDGFGDTSATPIAQEERAVTSSETGEMFFPKQKPGEGLYPSARIRGDLIVDPNGCLRIDRGGAGPGHLPLWPGYYELNTEGDRTRILDGEGDFVARVGGRIDTGGGEIHQGGTQVEVLRILEGHVGKEMARDLYESCPGPYWLVGPPGRPYPAVRNRLKELSEDPL
jgi:hypothetical protein